MTPARVLVVLFALALGSAPASAQRFTLRAEPTPAHELVCADTAALPDSSRAPDDPEVERLTDAATQAMILGDFEGALSFLDRAIGIDARATEPLWLRARVLHQAGRLHESTDAFCRFLALEPTGAPAQEARRRLDEARTADTVVAAIERDFASGVAQYRADRLAEAEASFTRVLGERPAAASALYNRGVVRLSAERFEAARADLERFRSLARLDATDSARVQGMIDWATASIGGPTAGRALGLGMLLPGGGQFYTSRPVLGTLMLGTSAGLLATGFLVERTRIRCLAPDPDGGCPPEQIASEETERPLLLPAVGVAALLWVGGAIEASLQARADRRAPEDGEVSLGLGRVELRVRADVTELRVTVPTGGRR